jgi:hypothetical protein
MFCRWYHRRFSLLKEMLVQLTLGLDVLSTHNTYMDLGFHVLQLNKEKVLLWRPGA